MPLNLPTQAAVDRSAPLEIYLVATPIKENGTTIETLEDPVGGPYGSLPGDPAGFPKNLSPRVSARQLTARYAAVRSWFASTSDRLVR
jgi:hypothetical protein